MLMFRLANVDMCGEALVIMRAGTEKERVLLVEE